MLYLDKVGGIMKKITAKEFRELGLLQEMNRLFLHPMGLALETIIEEDGSEHFGGVGDYRDDPEGMAFSEGTISTEKAQNVSTMFEKKAPIRKEILGWHVQPQD